MANANGGATVWSAPNYLGPLFTIGANQTPFLSDIGGTGGANARVAKSWEFPLTAQDALNAAAQPAITETASLTAPTATTYARTQTKNTCQIFQRAVNVSYAKQSDVGTLTGLAIAGEANPVPNERDRQIAMNLLNMSVDMEYTFLNGAYVAATDAGTAAKCRGIITGSTVNTVAALSAALSTAQVNSLLKTMADNGAIFANMAVYANAFQKQSLTKLFGYAPMDRNVGGVNVETIETDFAKIAIKYAPHVPAGTLLVADLSVIHPVFLPVPDKGYMFYEELSKVGAAESGQVYAQAGLDYGPAAYHGTITGLATS